MNRNRRKDELISESKTNFPERLGGDLVLKIVFSVQRIWYCLSLLNYLNTESCLKKLKHDLSL